MFHTSTPISLDVYTGGGSIIRYNEARGRVSKSIFRGFIQFRGDEDFFSFMVSFFFRLCSQ